MSVRPPVTLLLRALQARVRSNALKQEIVDALLLAGVSGMLLAIWNATMPVSMGLAWSWLLPVVAAAVIRAVMRLRLAFPLWKAAFPVLLAEQPVAVRGRWLRVFPDAG